MMLFCSVEESDHGPVSTMARHISAESLEVFGIGRQVSEAGIHGSACAFHPLRKTVMARFASFEHEPQTFIDLVLELATTQRCLPSANP